MNAPVEAGQMLAGKYRVDRVLGEGGMGVVVAATDAQLERQVAIKFLLPEYTQHTEAVQRFMREARAAVKIQSEHIARVIDVSKLENGSPYMVMEYLEGKDLSGVIEERGALPIHEAVFFVIQACEAVAEAHSYGIVHRDLKPANLFLASQPDGSSKVKVLDFGISKKTVPTNSGKIDPSLTRTASMMGSPLYMSPEQMKSTRDVDARTDIWALGVVLFELLSARVPFGGDSIPELSAKILLDDPDDITKIRPEVPPELATIIERCLKKNPGERYPTISELVLALLPHAPSRARTNVERITRMLNAAGLSDSAMQSPSLAPPVRKQLSSEPRLINVAATTPSLRPNADTVGAFGGTRISRIPGERQGKGIWLALGAVAVAAGIGAVVLFGGQTPNSLDGDAEASAASSGPANTSAAAQPTPRLDAKPVATVAPARAVSAQSEVTAGDRTQQAAVAGKAPSTSSVPKPEELNPAPVPGQAAPSKTVANASRSAPTPAPAAKVTATKTTSSTTPARTSSSNAGTSAAKVTTSTSTPTKVSAPAVTKTSATGFKSKFGSRK